MAYRYSSFLSPGLAAVLLLTACGDNAATTGGGGSGATGGQGGDGGDGGSGGEGGSGGHPTAYSVKVLDRSLEPVEGAVVFTSRPDGSVAATEHSNAAGEAAVANYGGSMVTAALATGEGLVATSLTGLPVEGPVTLVLNHETSTTTVATKPVTVASPPPGTHAVVVSVPCGQRVTADFADPIDMPIGSRCLAPGETFAVVVQAVDDTGTPFAVAAARQVSIDDEGPVVVDFSGQATEARTIAITGIPFFAVWLDDVGYFSAGGQHYPLWAPSKDVLGLMSAEIQLELPEGLFDRYLLGLGHPTFDGYALGRTIRAEALAEVVSFDVSPLGLTGFDSFAEIADPRPGLAWSVGPMKDLHGAMADLNWTTAQGDAQWLLLLPPGVEEIITPMLPSELGDYASTKPADFSALYLLGHCENPPTYEELLDTYPRYMPRLFPYDVGYEQSDKDLACTMFYAH
jgi:hypothetical protein